MNKKGKVPFITVVFPFFFLVIFLIATFYFVSDERYIEGFITFVLAVFIMWLIYKFKKSQ